MGAPNELWGQGLVEKFYKHPPGQKRSERITRHSSKAPNGLFRLAASYKSPIIRELAISPRIAVRRKPLVLADAASAR